MEKLGKNEAVNHEQGEIDLIDIIKILLKNKMLITIITIVVCTFSLIGAVVTNNNTKSAKAIIGYNYDGISDGKTPDGGNFSSMEIRNIIVMRRVYEKFPELKGMNISLTDLSGAIRISGITPDNINQIAEATLKRGEDYRFNPSNFSVDLKVSNDPQLDKEILSSILEEYMNYFSFKYQNYEQLSTINLNDFIDYDYIDRINIIKNGIAVVENLIERQEGQGFVSRQTGLGYEDVKNYLNVLRSVDLRNVNSEITINNVTNDLVGRKLVIENTNRDLNLEKEKLQGEVNVLKDMLDNYKPSERQMIVPTLGETGIKISTEEEYYTNLLNQYRDSYIRIKEIEVEIDYNNNIIKELHTPDEDAVNTVRRGIEKSVEKLNKIVEDINIMNLEYNNQYYSDNVRIIAAPEVVGSSKAKLIVALGLVMGLILGVMGAFIKEFYISMKREIKK